MTGCADGEMPATEFEAYFFQLSECIFGCLQERESLLINYEGEQSDFVRLNRNRIRQAGCVTQHTLRLDLIEDQRHCRAQFNLSGNLESDLQLAQAMLSQQRMQLPQLPADPFLYFATQPQNTFDTADDTLPSATEVIEAIISAAGDLDLVGLWAGGSMMYGFANSFGQRNWHCRHIFNFDWSAYNPEGNNMKQSYAGPHWDTDYLRENIDYTRRTLSLLAKPAKSIQPGRYRVFLAPGAMREIVRLLNSEAFSEKSHRTKQTPLLKLANGARRLSPAVTVIENNVESLAPRFTAQGFIKPDQVTLIEHGLQRDCLCDSRSAREYGRAVNCTTEQPQALQIGGGQLRQTDIMQSLGEGVFISNLWYTNYSDRNNCRITGMTRFACLWVENGEPVAPLSPTRFDESVFHLLGDKLVDLSCEHELLFNPESYERRSVISERLPGALVEDFTFTL